MIQTSIVCKKKLLLNSVEPSDDVLYAFKKTVFLPSAGWHGNMPTICMLHFEIMCLQECCTLSFFFKTIPKSLFQPI